MIRLTFDMPLILMGFYGGAMVLIVLMLRLLLGRWLPKRVMPVLWALVLVRLLVPFSVSSPLSLPVPTFLEDLAASYDRAAATSYVTFSSEIPPAGSFLTEGAASDVVSSRPQVDFGAAVDTIEEDEKQVISAEVIDRVPDAVWQLNNAARVSVTHSLGGWSWPSLWGVGFSGVWLVGMGVVALVLCWRYIHSRRGFQGVYELDENQTVKDTLIHCRVNARAYSCDTAKSPVVMGIFQPMILLPASLDFSNGELVRHILTHEAMHIRRWDNLMKLVLMAALCLHWYNPLVWVMAREYCRDMESACDEAALALLGADESAPYAESLLSMAVPGLSGGLFASAFSRTEVERRVKGVLAYKKPGFFTLTAAAVLLLSATVAFATCGQGFFDDTLSDWCYDGGDYIVRATLNRPIDLGDNRNYARSRANGAIYDALKAYQDLYQAMADKEEELGIPDRYPDYSGPGLTMEHLEGLIRQRLGGEFRVESGAFQVQIAPMVDREKLMEQYKEYGLEQDENGRWTMNGEEVHYLEDQITGVLYANSEGTVDVYVIRDEQYKLLRIESYDYYRF